MIRFILIVCLMAGPAFAEDETIRVGFRKDAPPFSYWDEKTDAYSGFIADLCVKALDAAGFGIEPVAITASTRFDELAKGGAAGGVDLLCEPASIQRKTMDNFLLSPIVYVTGVGFLQKPRGPDTPEDVLVGFLDGTTAETAVEIAEAQRKIEAIKGAKVIRRAIDNHWTGVEMVCAGKLEYYFGDLDILRALRAKLQEERGVDCADVIDSNRLKFTYEAYALPVNPKRPDVAVALQSGLYRTFSDASIRDIYNENFNLERSDYLQALFAINGVLPCGGIVENDPCAEDRVRLGQ